MSMASKKLQCLLCHVSYRSKFCSALHQHVHHQDLKKALNGFQCSLCKKRFIKFVCYQWHLLYHPYPSSVSSTEANAQHNGKSDDIFNFQKHPGLIINQYLNTETPKHLCP